MLSEKIIKHENVSKIVQFGVLNAYANMFEN